MTRSENKKNKCSQMTVQCIIIHVLDRVHNKAADISKTDSIRPKDMVSPKAPINDALLKRTKKKTATPFQEKILN